MDSPRLDEALLRICKAFNEAGVEYVVIGGFAMILHGFPRFTEDIDLMINPEASNLRSMKSAISVLFGDDSINGVSDEDFEKYAVIRYGTEDGYYIDLMTRIGEVADFHLVNASRMELVVQGVKIPVCSPEMLLYLKQDTVRHKDKVDAAFLREKLHIT